MNDQLSCYQPCSLFVGKQHSASIFLRHGDLRIHQRFFVLIVVTVRRRMRCVRGSDIIERKQQKKIWYHYCHLSRRRKQFIYSHRLSVARNIKHEFCVSPLHFHKKKMMTYTAIYMLAYRGTAIANGFMEFDKNA